MSTDRMLRSLLLVAGVMFCSTPIVHAQPLFHSEHEWTVQINNCKFGLDRRIQEPGGWQQTQIWLAGRPFAPEARYEDRIVFLLPAATELYVAHAISRFVFESCFDRNRPGIASHDQWVVLSQRLLLPYFRCSPRIFDPSQIGRF